MNCSSCQCFPVPRGCQAGVVTRTLALHTNCCTELLSTCRAGTSVTSGLLLRITDFSQAAFLACNTTCLCPGDLYSWNIGWYANSCNGLGTVVTNQRQKGATERYFLPHYQLAKCFIKEEGKLNWMLLFFSLFFFLTCKHNQGMLSPNYVCCTKPLTKHRSTILHYYYYYLIGDSEPAACLLRKSNCFKLNNFLKSCCSQK